MRGTCLEHKTVAIHGFFALHVRWLCFWCWPSLRGLRVIFQCFQSGFINSPLRFTSLFGCGTFIIMYYLSRARKPKFSPSFLNRGYGCPLQCLQRHQRSRSVCAIVMVVSCMVSCRTCQCVTVGIRGNGVPLVDCSSQATWHWRRLPPSDTCLSSCCSPTLTSSHELAERRHSRVTNAHGRQPALHQLRVRCRRIHRPSAAVVARPTPQAHGPRPSQLPRSPQAVSGAPRQQRSSEGTP